MFRELKHLEDKYRRIILSLSDPAFLSNPQKVREISKERAELEPVIRKYEELKRIARDREESCKILEDPGADPDLKGLAEGEVEELGKREKALEAELKLLLLPKNPYDEKNVILEIR
ncbi:MAG: PCRF domain-containing protein, partial [Candidatus Aminicenantes bacterium]|nr:PCRF domain-containing protein [Candidatus Aminicenantes bacterium]